jgi:hypothetical protein
VASEYGLSMKLYNDKMIIYDQTSYEKKEAACTVSRDSLGGDGAYSYSAQITTVYDSVRIQYTKGKQTLTYSYTIPGKKGNRTMYITSKADSLREAEIKAKAKLRENLRNSKSITLQLTGDTRYKAAQNIELEGFGKLDGKYFIDKVEHDKSGGKYESTVTAHPVVTSF